MRNAALRWTEAKADVTEASTSDGSPMEVTSTQSEGSSSESLRVSTPMVRFLVLDSEDTSSRSPDSPMQEAPLEAANETSSEEGESFESWSDPDRTLATMDRNVGLAMNIF